MLPGNADLGGPAEKLVPAALLANTAAAQAQLGKLSRAAVMSLANSTTRLSAAHGTVVGTQAHAATAIAKRFTR